MSDHSTDAENAPAPHCPPEADTLPHASQTILPVLLADVHVPGYEILKELGRGGMGVVYQARHVQLDRVVALKMVLAGAHAGPDDLVRFRTEAEAVARLTHPNIVQIHEIGEHEGKPFFSLELVSGGSLHDKLDGTPLPAQEAAQLVQTLARAIHVAHQRNVIHRDLKPANVLLTEDGTPKITDFGLAKKLDEASQTQSGAIMGTPSYLAPEQAGDKQLPISPATDVYALGAILYECLTGRPPFKAATAMDTVLQVISNEPVAPRQLQPRTPRDLETICLKCLQKEPAKRYQSAEELADDLQRWSNDEPIVARRVGAWERCVKWMKRRPALASLLLVSFAAALALLILAGFLWRNAEQRAKAVQDLEQARRRLKSVEQLADQKRTEAETEAARAKRAQDVARGIRYAADVQFANAAWSAEDLPQTFALLDKYSKPDSADLRGFEWHYLWRLAHDDRFSFATSTRKSKPLVSDDEVFANPVLLALSPDEKTVATTGPDQPITLWDSATGRKVRVIKKLKAAITAAWFASDGKTIQTVGIVNESNKFGGFKDFEEMRKVYAGQVPPSLRWMTRTMVAHSIAVKGRAPPQRIKLDLRRLGCALSFLAQGSAGVMTMAQRVVPIKQGNVLPLCLALAPNKKTLAIAGISTDVRNPLKPHQVDGVLLWDLERDKPLHLLRGTELDMPLAVAFSPDGRTLAIGGVGKTVSFWDPAESIKRQSRQHVAMATALVGTLGKTVLVWDASAVTGKPSRTLKHKAIVSALAYSPKGRYLATGTADGALKIWHTADHKPLRTCTGHRNLVSGLRFTDDGKTLVSVDAFGVVKFWDVQVRRDQLVIQAPNALVPGLTFSRDGESCHAVDPQGTLYHWQTTTGQLRSSKKLANFQLIRRASFSADANWVAMTDVLQKVKIFDVVTGKEGQKINDLPESVGRVALSPTGKTLAMIVAHNRKRSSIFLADVGSGGKSRKLGELATQVTDFAYSPDGKQLAASGIDRALYLWSTTSGERRAESLKHVRSIACFAFAPDGKRIAAAGGDLIIIWDWTTGKELIRLRGHSHKPKRMAFNPAGTRLVTAGGIDDLGRGGGCKIWSTRTGQQVLTVGRPTETIMDVAFSPDGHRLAVTRREAKMFDFLSKQPTEIRIFNAAPLPKR